MTVTAWKARHGLNLEALEADPAFASCEIRRLPGPTGSRRPQSDDVTCFSVRPDVPADTSPIFDFTTLPRSPKTFFVFRDGTVVGWNASHSDIQAILLAAQASSALSPVSETLKFSMGQTEHPDVISLPSDNAREKLPYSLALSQSLKIDAVELTLRPILADVKKWQKEMAASGHIGCTVKHLRQTKARLLAVFDEMDFNANLHTTPRVLWTSEFQQFRSLFKTARNHLEIDDRLDVLEERAETVNEALDYLSGEVHSEANEFLTWVIIWLIGFEIALALDLDSRIVSLIA